MLDEREFDFRNAGEHEGTEGSVVQMPDPMGFGVGCWIWAGEASIEPFGEALIVREIF